MEQDIQMSCFVRHPVFNVIKRSSLSPPHHYIDIQYIYIPIYIYTICIDLKKLEVF